MTAGSHMDFRRLVERDTLTGLTRRHRERLHDHLRACAACRAHHDRLHEGFRALEGEAGPAVSRLELEQVERWLIQDRAVAGRPWARLAAWMSPALLAVAGLVLALRPQAEPPASVEGNPLPDHVLGLVAKGGREPAVLSVDVLCGERPEALHAAAPVGCRLDETLAFAYRTATRDASGVLSLFGVDDEGRALYYTPTPVEPGGVWVENGVWRAAPLSVRLSVNHRPGALRVFALLASRALTVKEIDTWAAAVASKGPELGAAWHQTVGLQSSSPLCGDRSGLDANRCHSAFITLDINPQTKQGNESP